MHKKKRTKPACRQDLQFHRPVQPGKAGWENGPAFAGRQKLIFNLLYSHFIRDKGK